MASIWKGSLAFGLVNIPVEAKTAVREDHVSFRMLHSEDMSPVKYERVCAADGEPVPWSEIVKGYEYEKGKFVVASLAERFEPEKYTDEYRANLMKIIRAKLKGKKASLPEPQHAEADAQVIDLMSRLRDSLKQDKGRGGAVRARAKTAAAGEKAPPRRKRATKTA